MAHLGRIRSIQQQAQTALQSQTAPIQFQAGIYPTLNINRYQWLEPKNQLLLRNTSRRLQQLHIFQQTLRPESYRFVCHTELQQHKTQKTPRRAALSGRRINDSGCNSHLPSLRCRLMPEQY